MCQCVTAASSWPWLLLSQGTASFMFVKSEECPMTDRDTTLTSHGNLPFHQSVGLQLSADFCDRMWSSSALPTLPFRISEAPSDRIFFIFFFLTYFFSHQNVLISHHFIFVDILWSRYHRFFPPYFRGYLWGKCSLSRKPCY